MSSPASTHPVPGAWAYAQVPVRPGLADPGTVTLAQLGNPTVHRALRRRLERVAVSVRSQSMTLVHYALAAVSGVVLAPLAADGALVVVEPDQLGLDVGPRGSLDALRVGCWRAGPPDDPAQTAGRPVQRLLAPVVHETRHVTGLGSRGIDNVLAEVLARDAREFQTFGAAWRSPDWIDALLEGAELPARPPRRTVTAFPDAGGPVAVDGPATCCVLAREPGPGACPACPQHPPHERRSVLEQWLRGLSAEDFQAVTGRPPRPGGA